MHPSSTRYRLIVAFAGLTLFLSACSKKWEETCNMPVYIETSGISSDMVSVSEISLQFSSFSLSGSRMQGEGFGVEKGNLQANLNPVLEPISTILFTTLEIPQGTYTSFNFDFTLEQKDDLPALHIDANFTYEDDEGEDENIVISITLKEPFIFSKAMYDIEKNLVAEENYPVYLSLDLNYLIGGITQEMLDAAAEDSEGPIQVNENTNVAIYNAIKERVIPSCSVRF